METMTVMTARDIALADTAERLINMHKAVQVWRVVTPDWTALLCSVESSRINATLDGWQNPRTLVWREDLNLSFMDGAEASHRRRVEQFGDVGHRVMGISFSDLTTGSITGWLDQPFIDQDGNHDNVLNYLSPTSTFVVPVSRDIWTNQVSEMTFWNHIHHLDSMQPAYGKPEQFWNTAATLAELYRPIEKDFRHIGV